MPGFVDLRGRLPRRARSTPTRRPSSCRPSAPTCARSPRRPTSSPTTSPASSSPSTRSSATSAAAPRRSRSPSPTPPSPAGAPWRSRSCAGRSTPAPRRCWSPRRWPASARSLARYLGAPRGARDADLARDLGVPPWKVRTVRDQSRSWSADGHRRRRARGGHADADIKGQAHDASYTLERLVLTVAGLRDGALTPAPEMRNTRHEGGCRQVKARVRARRPSWRSRTCGSRPGWRG